MTNVIGANINAQAEQTATIERPQNIKPVDLVHLSKQTFGSKELENEVLGLFRNHSQVCLKRMKEAKSNKDWADAAHSIKGSARAIGAWEIGERAEYYERQAEAGELSDKNSACEDIGNLVEETNSYISTLIEAA